MAGRTFVRMATGLHYLHALELMMMMVRWSVLVSVDATHLPTGSGATAVGGVGAAPRVSHEHHSGGDGPFWSVLVSLGATPDDDDDDDDYRPTGMGI